MSFEVDVGYASLRGAREVNEDFAGAVRAAPHEKRGGLIGAVADGVSEGGRGLEAAQTTVMGLLNDFFSAPATWETTVALDRLIGAQNGWLAAQNRRRPGEAPALTTLTALALQGQTWTLAHVGDTRAWLLRDGELSLLSQDHAFEHPDQRSRLIRAVGLDDALRIDFEQGDARIGDVFVLTSDGVHGALKRDALAALAQRAFVESAEAAATALVDAALKHGSRDNMSALVIHVKGLAPPELDDNLQRGRQLPAPPRLKIGDVLDGYTVTAVVADTGVHRLYQARDNATRELVAIKALHEARANDPQERAMQAHEAWLGLRLGEQLSGASGVGHPAPAGFVGVREPLNPSAFYTVFDWHGGQTLEQALQKGQRFTVDEAIAGTLAVARALGRLHRQGVIHRDIKPANLHRGDDGQWRVLDLGVAVSGRESEVQRSLHAGTPSYMNPEQWQNADGQAGMATPQSDLYALGVTLYQWLTGRLPYGEVEPYQLARFRQDPRAPSRLRPEVPIWLDHVVLKAVARDARLRFETAEELVLALERGASRPLAGPSSTPLLARDPAGLWKVALALSVAVNLLLIYWLLFLPK
jgi:serine/threonine protein phosphatase PrpC